MNPSMNEYFHQVIPVFDTGTPGGGDGTTVAGLTNVQSMVNYDTKTVSTDILQSYTSDGSITVNSPVVFTAGTTGIDLTANQYFSTGSVIVNNVYVSTNGVFQNVYANYGDFDRVSTGQLYVSSYGIFGSTVTALDFLQPSDRRKKINVAPLQGAYSTLEELQGVSFEWKDTLRNDVGFLAQDVEVVIPGAVTIDGNGDYHMSYQKMIPYLVESVKELGMRVSTLEGMLAARS